MATGEQAKNAGGELGIAKSTYKNHVSHIFQKMNVQDRISAVMTGLRLGIIPLEEEKLWKIIREKT